MRFSLPIRMPVTVLTVLAGLLAGSGPPALAESPPINYMLQCRGCHLADGSGSPLGVPALAGFVGKFLLVPGGREYLVRVPGSAQAPISDRELAELLNWIVRRFGPEEVAANFIAFRAGEVARYRNVPLTDVAVIRDKLVRQIESAEIGARSESQSAGDPAR